MSDREIAEKAEEYLRQHPLPEIPTNFPQKGDSMINPIIQPLYSTEIEKLPSIQDPFKSKWIIEKNPTNSLKKKTSE